MTAVRDTAVSYTTLPGTSGPARAFGRTMFTKTLFDNRRIFTVWAAATGLLAMMYAGFYPQITADTASSVPEAMRGFGFDDMTAAAGYLQGAVFGLLVPLLATFYGAATGARIISADEESGYLDLLLAHPIGRTRLLLHRFTALATGALLTDRGRLAAPPDPVPLLHRRRTPQERLPDRRRRRPGRRHRRAHRPGNLAIRPPRPRPLKPAPPFRLWSSDSPGSGTLPAGPGLSHCHFPRP
ncbi:ABC transporter permease subunit [Spirillospora sp. CA-255316]